MELQVCAICAVSIAAVVDWRTRRIPNWLTFLSLVTGLVMNAWIGGLTGLGLALAGAALGVLVLLPFYAVGAIGAGDVKLMGAVGALFGPQLLLSVAIYTALAGGVMSLILLLVRGRLLMALNDVFVYHRPPSRSGLTAPYGVAIASGVYLSLILPGFVG
jgi:prepilin peptidase CpaA